MGDRKGKGSENKNDDVYSRDMVLEIQKCAFDITGIKYPIWACVLMRNATFDAVTNFMSEHRTVHIPRFGEFSAHRYPPKRMITCKNEEVIVPEHYGPKFRPTLFLKECVAEGSHAEPEKMDPADGDGGDFGG